MLDTFDAVRRWFPGPLRARRSPTPAATSARAAPGRSHADPSRGLDKDGWARFARGLASVVARCRDRGYEPTFHHETGHLRRGALGDRARPGDLRRRVLPRHRSLLHRRWRPGGGAAATGPGRINHVHVKDALRSRDGRHHRRRRADHRRSGRARPSPRWATATSTSRACSPRSRPTTTRAGWSWNRTSSPRRPSDSRRPSRTSRLIAASSPSTGSRTPCSDSVSSGRAAWAATHLRALRTPPTSRSSRWPSPSTSCATRRSPPSG